MRDHDTNRNRPRRRGLTGFATILLITVTLCLVWTTKFISFLIPLHPMLMNIFYTISGSYPWLEPIIYLLTNSEARRLCLEGFRQCFKNGRRALDANSITSIKNIHIYVNAQDRLRRSPWISSPLLDAGVKRTSAILQIQLWWNSSLAIHWATQFNESYRTLV